MEYDETNVLPLVHRTGPRLGFENVYNRVLQTAQRKIQTEADLERYLTSWWCIRYNRPYKDPLLLSYSLEELIVEYLDVSYRSNPEAFREKKEIEQAKKEDDDWAEKMAEKFGEKLMSPEDQAKHEEDIENALAKHAEDNEVDDILAMGRGTHHKFDVQD